MWRQIQLEIKMIFTICPSPTAVEWLILIYRSQQIVENRTNQIGQFISLRPRRCFSNYFLFPFRVTNEEDRVLQQELNVDEANGTFKRALHIFSANRLFFSPDLTNDQSSSIEDEISNSSPALVVPPPPLPMPQVQPSQQQAEAYCNLCERSFCNKYFLKTHMAKKHNILNNVSPLPSTEHNDSMSLSPSTDQQQQQQPAVPLMVPTPPTAKPMDKFSEDYCEVRWRISSHLSHVLF